MSRDRDIFSPADTIVATATANAPGAVAIVRVSGAAAHAIAAQLFVPARESQAAVRPGLMRLGRVVDPRDGDVIDEALAVVWRGPHSFTGEDVAEFHTHGSPLIVARVVAACVAAGARHAQPGEFTRRAYLNGRLDLAQAEAVADLVQAETEAARRAALALLSGGLTARIGVLRERLLPVLAELEASVDFPEEGLEFATRSRLGAEVDAVRRDLAALMASARAGRPLREGARVVLAGPPNAGKSSLFNALVGRERALVSPHPGTTRDTIEASVDLAGIPLTLVDTAGLRAEADEIEALGIARTEGEVAAAGLVLFVIDASQPKAARGALARVEKAPHLLVLNKADATSRDAASLVAEFPSPVRRAWCVVSSHTRAGLDELEAQIARELGATAAPGSLLVTHRRHAEALAEADAALAEAAQGIAGGLATELSSADVTAAIAALDCVAGRRGLDDDLLDTIFARFCLGK